MDPYTSQDSFLLRLKNKLSGLTYKRKELFALSVLFFVAVYIYTFFHRPPYGFPVGQIITIESGESLKEITNTLYDTHVIRSPFVFRITVILLGGEKKLKAGDYLLDTQLGPADLAYRFMHGEYHLQVVKITIPEGWNVKQIGDYLSTNLTYFNKSHFSAIAKSKEGYLFPDTYFVSPAAKPEKIVELMTRMFVNKIQSVPGVSTTTRSLDDLITMASILEEEARTTESKRMIAGILWKRLDMGMPLQVDSTFLYINGKTTYELTQTDLQIDSAYNTYVYKGLPPTPISNPGTDSIFAAANPISSKYLYYLSSRSGKMYYATTYEQHKRNRELYLNK